MLRGDCECYRRYKHVRSRQSVVHFDAYLTHKNSRFRHHLQTSPPDGHVQSSVYRLALLDRERVDLRGLNVTWYFLIKLCSPVTTMVCLKAKFNLCGRIFFFIHWRQFTQRKIGRLNCFTIWLKFTT